MVGAELERVAGDVGLRLAAVGAELEGAMGDAELEGIVVDSGQKISLAEGEPARLEEGIAAVKAASAYKGSKQASIAGGESCLLAEDSIKLRLEVLMNAWWAYCEFKARFCWDFVKCRRRMVEAGETGWGGWSQNVSRETFVREFSQSRVSGKRTVILYAHGNFVLGNRKHAA